MNKLLILSLFSFVTGCGVRGDPIPPQEPPELGRGQPMYKEATKDLAAPYVPPLYDSENEKENEKKKNR